MPSDRDLLTALAKLPCHLWTQDERDAVLALARKGVEWQEQNYFVCPSCSGTHFGRHTARSGDGTVDVLDTVSCHDEHGRGCKWSGVWPLKGTPDAQP